MRTIRFLGVWRNYLAVNSRISERFSEKTSTFCWNVESYKEDFECSFPNEHCPKEQSNISIITRSIRVAPDRTLPERTDNKYAKHVIYTSFFSHESPTENRHDSPPKQAR